MATPLVLVSLEVVDTGVPVEPTTLTIADILVVSPSVPAPSLVDGRPV